MSEPRQYLSYLLNIYESIKELNRWKHDSIIKLKKIFLLCVLKSKNLLMCLFVHMNAIIVLLQFSYWQNHVFFSSILKIKCLLLNPSKTVTPAIESIICISKDAFHFGHFMLISIELEAGLWEESLTITSSFREPCLILHLHHSGVWRWDGGHNFFE